MRGEDEEDEEQRETENRAWRHTLGGLVFLIRHAEIVVAHAGRHGFAEDLLHGAHGLCGGVSRSDGGIDLRAAEHVVAHREFGTEGLLGRNEGVHRHGFLFVVGNVKHPQVVEVGAVFALSLHIDLPLEAEAVEVIHKVTTEECLHGLVGVREAHALDHGLRLVHREMDLRHIPERCGEEGG